MQHKKNNLNGVLVVAEIEENGRPNYIFASENISKEEMDKHITNKIKNIKSLEQKKDL